MERFGRVDVLVNNAGVATTYPASREPPEEFARVIDINLNGSYYMAQACGRVMRAGSSIINIGSVLGSTTAGLPQAAYCSSKAAIIRLTRDLAQQWSSRKGIRVNAVAPRFFASEITDEYPERYIEDLLSRVPIGRVGKPAEALYPVLFLASGAVSYVTGILMPVVATRGTTPADSAKRFCALRRFRRAIAGRTCTASVSETAESAKDRQGSSRRRRPGRVVQRRNAAVRDSAECARLHRTDRPGSGSTSRRRSPAATATS